MTTFFHNRKLDTFLVLWWLLDIKMSKKKKRGECCVKREPYNSHIEALLLRGSRKWHITHVGIFPPNCIVPVSFPIVSVKGLWWPWAYHCSAPSVVLSPTTKEVGTARIGGMSLQSVSFSLTLLACNLTPSRRFAEDSLASGLEQGLTLPGSVILPERGQGPQLMPSSIPVMYVSEH